jgi:hypothetical protein
MIFQIKENMSYRNIKAMENEDSLKDIEIHLLISQTNKLKVNFYLI